MGAQQCKELAQVLLKIDYGFCFQSEWLKMSYFYSFSFLNINRSSSFIAFHRGKIWKWYRCKINNRPCLFFFCFNNKLAIFHDLFHILCLKSFHCSFSVTGKNLMLVPNLIRITNRLLIFHLWPPLPLFRAEGGKWRTREEETAAFHSLPVSTP